MNAQVVLYSIAPAAENALQTMQDLNWAQILVLPFILLVWWGFKKDWYGVRTFGPYERGFREYMGAPGKRLLGQGWHAFIMGIGAIRETTISKITIKAHAEAATREGRVHAVSLDITTQVVDDRDHAYSAIYRTADVQKGKGDVHNAQRLEAIQGICQQAMIMRIRETETGSPQISLESLLSCLIPVSKGDPDLIEAGITDEFVSVEQLIDTMCGSRLHYAFETVNRPVGEQLHKDGLLGDKANDGSESVGNPTHERFRAV